MSNDNSTCGCDSKNIGIPTQERTLCIPKHILIEARQRVIPVSYTHLRAHET